MADRYKTVALRLHALSEKDRHWCMEQLTELQKERLNHLLDELSVLGIPKVPLSTDELTVLRASGTGDGRVSGECQPDIEQRIAAADPVVVGDLLRGEPDVLVAALVQSGNWPWASAVLAGFSESRRQRVSDYMDNQVSPASTRIKSLMLESFAEKFKALSGQGQATGSLRIEDAPIPRPGLFRRLLWQR